MKSWHIHIEGQVQGVGFRPFVYKEALKLNVQGWVCNGIDGVHIQFNSSKEQANLFYNSIIDNAPELSVILNHTLEEVKFENYESFKIVESLELGSPNLLLTPDFALCPDCRKELGNEKDRRYQYPFITCTNCGPRYSIVKSLPYDRPRTTMDNFHMCPECKMEYDDPLMRRHFSQTNSCHNCAISLFLEDGKGNIKDGNSESIIQKTCNLLLEGKIIAVKGIGGYLLFADAKNTEIVHLLRRRKNRPSKPFALMYRNIEATKQDVRVSKEEEELLKSVASPIVLMKRKRRLRSGIDARAIAPGLGDLGVMLPYTPLFELMMQKLDGPMVATSANISGSPVVFSDSQARKQLFNICDFILSNDREIVVPQDDSVIKVLPDKKQLVMRRSRGLAPTFVHESFQKPVSDLLAMGAMLKSTFALTHNDNTYISQYLGDLESFDTQLSYDHTLNHFFKLFGPDPKKILIDMHPDYYSTIRGKDIAEEKKLPVKEIQHHEAHFMSVISENGLHTNDDPVLGVIWDGTGLGHDRNIWGGEYFLYKENEIERVGHIPYYDHILGDKFAREPRLAALSLCHSYCLNHESLIAKFSKEEWALYNKVLERSDNLMTSSMGRLFDGVSSIIGAKDENTYEGEAAMYLQHYAEKFVKKNGTIVNTFISLNSSMGQCINELMIGVNAGIDKGKLAYDFLIWLVNQVMIKADEENVEKIAFSGGVFQNSLLLYLLKNRLDSEFELYFNKRLSPNDENISFGQLAYDHLGVGSKLQVQKEGREQVRSGVSLIEN